ncbi:LacI family DNA-binding transcriptional regulator [Flagellimonas flava]|uniref:LacI family transcriptional regulator n=1 Tax=Flagellimonas flava TaxID=570519 RepID=A0A1M5JX33_9FLAO|nr:LacI family DNA-binding transcriptional regulator [Allomuricauda flava]SHG45104.1 LacI family transcriptional regulator [Allomuricauda flava]
MRAKHTIKDIAEKAGVSIGTVDRVLHERGRVSKASERKIVAAIKELDYKPNPIAQTLKNGIVHKIGVLLPNPDLDSFWRPCEEGIQEVISEYSAFTIDVVLYYFNPFKSKSFLQLGHKAYRDGVHALFFVPLFDRETNSILEKFDDADVLLATFNSPLLNTIDLYVGQDLVLSGRTAARLLHMSSPDKGKFAIVHINESFENAGHMRKKEQGFISYCIENGLNAPLTITLMAEEFKTKLVSFLEMHQDLQGIFVTTSKAHEVAKVLDSINQEKIILIGYDLLDENLEYLQKGTIDFLIHQDPKTQASLGLRYVIENLLFKKEFPKEKLLPIGIINSENAKSYIAQASV